MSVRLCQTDACNGDAQRRDREEMCPVCLRGGYTCLVCLSDDACPTCKRRFCLDCGGSDSPDCTDCWNKKREAAVPEKEQRAVVAYILREDGKILSVTRKDTGEHSAPGGKVEPGETSTAALLREVYEETGLRITGWLLVHEGLHPSGRRVLSFLIKCDWYSGEPVAREPGTRVVWVGPIEIVNGFGGERARESLIVAGILKA